MASKRTYAYYPALKVNVETDTFCVLCCTFIDIFRHGEYLYNRPLPFFPHILPNIFNILVTWAGHTCSMFRMAMPSGISSFYNFRILKYVMPKSTWFKKNLNFLYEIEILGKL